SWNWKNEGPETTGDLYTTAYKFKVLKDSRWEIDRDPVQDLDQIHGTRIWNSLKIETFTLVFGV
ncbi:MAG: hypothetical protein NZ961_11780, partial [Candidatus Poribacteria bacterium]|nr:hypothetical protein [Candidatus Poribacteria bacterium]